MTSVEELERSYVSILLNDSKTLSHGQTTLTLGISSTLDSIYYFFIKELTNPLNDNALIECKKSVAWVGRLLFYVSHAEFSKRLNSSLSAAEKSKRCIIDLIERVSLTEVASSLFDKASYLRELVRALNATEAFIEFTNRIISNMSPAFENIIRIDEIIRLYEFQPVESDEALNTYSKKLDFLKFIEHDSTEELYASMFSTMELQLAKIKATVDQSSELYANSGISPIKLERAQGLLKEADRLMVNLETQLVVTGQLMRSEESV